jgi:hypothetical protein
MGVTALPAGATPKGTELKTWSDQIDALTSQAWTAYGTDTTIVTTTTTSPTKGNSTWSAEYRRPPNSNLVMARFRYDIGSTFSAGSGLYRFLLPIAMSASALSRDLGIGLVNDQGTAYRTLIAVPTDTTHLYLVRPDNGSPLDNNGPGTAWASTDIIRFNITYEPA